MATTTAQPTGLRSRKWCVPEGAIGAGIAESDFGTAPQIRAALHRAVDEDLLTYLPDQAAREATDAFVGFARRRYGWPLEEHQVHIVPDVLSALSLALTHLVRPGPVMVPTPAYGPFLSVPRHTGRAVVAVPSRGPAQGWQPDLDAIEDAFASGAALLIWCNPHNPTGTVTDAATMSAVAQIASRHHGRVFADEIHAPILYDGRRHVPFASVSEIAAEVAVTATSASKGWNIPGLKSAQLITSNPTDAHAIGALGLLPTHLGSVLGAVGASQAYSVAGEAWLDRTTARFEHNRDEFFGMLADEAPAIRARRPDGTYLAWLDFSDCPRLADDPAGNVARTAGVVVSPGSDSGPGYDTYARLNFALQPRVLREAAARLIAVAG